MPIQIDLGSGKSETKKVVPQGPVIGIDLGTTHSLVAVVRANGTSEVLTSTQAPDGLVPSAVLVDANGKPQMVGREALAARKNNPGRVLTSVKRLMGRKREDLKDTLELIPYTLEDDPTHFETRICVGDARLSPVEISAEILKHLKKLAAESLGEVPTRAVITVPAYFDDAQRTATKAAGRLAGLEVIRILNEPTAAALAYGWSNENPGLVAIFDLGGGTFDISVLRIEENLFEVLSTGGDTRLGGDDLDRATATYVLEKLIREHAVTPPANNDEKNRVVGELMTEAERVKKELSAKTVCEFQALGKTISLTRSELETLWSPWIDRCLEICKRALDDARLDGTALKDVLLVGGSTRMPLVRQKVKEFFGKEPNVSMNPDQAIALGAALQANHLAGTGSDKLLVDIIPLSLGIETLGGAVSKIISRNSQIPTEAREVFTNHAENQNAFDFHVLQGEREMAKDCRSLARFKLRGLEAAPAGFHRIEVLFRIDANGILNVRATDLRTQLSREIEVKPSYGLDENALFEMLETAFENAEEDIATRQLVDLRVEAEGVIKAADNTAKKAGHLIAAQDLAVFKARLTDLRNVSHTGSLTELQKALDQLEEVGKELAEAQVNAALQSTLSGRKV